MKIVFFVHCFFPDHFYGTETYTLGLAKHYRAWGHDVTVVSAVFQGETKQPELLNRYSWEGIPVIAIDKNAIPHSRIKETYYQPEMRDVLEGILAELKPDIVHITHLINHTAVLLEVTGNLGIPTYTTFTDFFGFCFNNKLETANGNLCAGPSRSRANCVACYLKEASQNGHAGGWLNKATTPVAANIISKGLVGTHKLGLLKNNHLEGMLEDLILRPDTLSYLYNTHYKGAVAPTAFLKKAYEKNGIIVPMTKLWFGIDIDRQTKPVRCDDHVPVIGYIGQIAPHKGTDLIIEAFKRLPKNSAVLKIYGPTNQSVSYMEELREMSDGVEGISFMGTFEQSLTANIFREMDLFVIPSRWYENSPLVLLNSLATHTPVLVSDVEGMTEFLNEGENGYCFKRGDANDLAEKLARVLQTPGLLRKLSLTTEYLRTTEVMAKDTFNLYQPN